MVVEVSSQNRSYDRAGLELTGSARKRPLPALGARGVGLGGKPPAEKPARSITHLRIRSGIDDGTLAS